MVSLLWPCAHLILPATGFGKFRLYSKGLYCALDLTTEEPNNKILLYATVVEGSLVTLAVLYFKELYTKSCCKRVRWWLGEKFYLTSKKNDVYHYSLSLP